jgi:archaellum component FlaC
MSLNLIRKCGICQGTGEEVSDITEEDGSHTVTTITCRSCGGEGIKTAMELSDEFEDIIRNMSDTINDIVDTLADIKEKVDEL